MANSQKKSKNNSEEYDQKIEKTDEPKVQLEEEKEENCECENCECSEEEEKNCDCEGEKEELKNQVKRALADYQNLEKRIQDQRQEWARSSNKDLIVRLLPVLDTLMLAGKHVEDKGLQLAIQQFLATLKQEGVEQIKTIGEEFDPNLMEGVGKSEGEEGKVIEEVRSGFRLYDKILRPAQVIVGGATKS